LRSCHDARLTHWVLGRRPTPPPGYVEARA
jgi:hypothetical protein